MKSSRRTCFLLVQKFLLLLAINCAEVRCDQVDIAAPTVEIETTTANATSGQPTGNWAPIVKIAQGKLQGSIDETRNGQTYYGYLGIPYAKPPARFQPPEPATIPGWEGVRNATIAGSMCSQTEFFSTTPEKQVLGSEDCLFVNVYTKHNASSSEEGGDADGDQLKPVLVYIHGGGFVVGAGNGQGGDYILDEPIVYVTINYRLSSLGFLNIGEWHDDVDADADKVTETATDTDNDRTPDYSQVANGNMGLKDQTMALKWIKENIKAFGGDPTKVTIFGTSAGSASVMYHFLSPTSSGLFHGGIAASGSALNPWAVSKNPNLYAKELGKGLNCPISDSTKLIKCLLEKDAKELIAKSDIKSPRAPSWHLDPVATFGPSVDSRIGDNQVAFLPKNPDSLYRAGEFNKVPLLIGVTTSEGLFIQAGRVLVDDTLRKELNDNWNKIAPVTFGLQDEIPDTNLDEASVDIRAFYLGSKCISVNETLNELDNLYGDRNFVHGVRQSILHHAKNSSPVYPYIFDYVDNDSTVGKFLFAGKLDTSGKVLHGEDMKYAFGSKTKSSGYESFLALGNGTEVIDFSKKYVKLLVSFASTGKPDASILRGPNVEWPSVNAQQANGEVPLQWYHLNTATPGLDNENEALSDRMVFWDNLFKKYAKS